MAEKFIRHEHSIKKFYKCLDDIIAQNQIQKRRILMFGSGIPANMAIYYLKIHDVTVEAILDNNPAKQGTEQYNTPIYAPAEYLSEYDDTILIMIASSYEDAMIKQLEELGYGKQQVIQLIQFQEAMSDYSFSNRDGFRELDRMEIRQHQLNVLKHIKSVCDKHGLRYWLSGGTLLGAVRHQGYIPWDDDIDVWVEMKDLKKLTKILKTDPKYGIATYVDETVDFCDSCSYMYEISSDMDVNYFPMQVSCGISIDLFPMVGLPDDEAEMEQYATQIKILEENVWNKMYSKSELRKAATELMDFMSRYDFDKCQNCGYILSRHFTKERMPAAYYTEPTEMMFEGELYKVPGKWHDLLVNLFGENYMMLPPKEEQVAHHNFKAYMPK